MPHSTGIIIKNNETMTKKELDVSLALLHAGYEEIVFDIEKKLNELADEQCEIKKKISELREQKMKARCEYLKMKADLLALEDGAESTVGDADKHD